ncbi:PLP-dependent aminotransferase family protein [Alicyclobacillus cycloheptanicus]|uniref:DNA-binding transcriptional MocR family regulator n=1 Tax=Alicyclobacillus cycloheptanicus TaxID=1457 RepID=A0ABT9XF03_9BACL|nr:PLP-dependent aminotransferase family protein [Alicyclobacillus cycloheptanicus]MDQ0188876.1 DNA-binding transcriptional MocR family regulator [Alicyclobacillus cycloheptanicus]WDM00483.1 PLP-dependent aminotransferase family protein [Alicyclobacillus cycloheptanicus]
MSWHLDFDDNASIYRQIVEFIEEKIRNGELPPGSPLPPERKLAEWLKVNRSTVSVAYDELRSKGLIRSRQGSGTRVSEDAWGLDFRAPDWTGYLSQGIFQPTVPMVRRIWEENQKTTNINLARGEMSSELWPTAQLRALTAQLSTPVQLGYGNPRGEDSLRSAVSKHLANQHEIKVSQRQILITAGSQQGLLLVIQSLLRPGDAVALERPSYAYSLPLFASAGVRMFPVPVDEDGLLPDEVVTLYRKHRIRMVFITPTYQNPTGTVLTHERRQRLIEICTDLRIPIVEDNAHGDLTLPGSPQPPAPLAAMEGAEQQVIYLGTLSKTFAPGLRIGWMTGPPSVIDRIAGIREQMDFGISGITQAIAAQVLATGIWEQNMVRLRSELMRRRNAMVRSLSQIFDGELEFAVPQGSYHIWAKLNKPLREQELAEATIRHGVVVVPGSVYGAEPGYVRLTYASSPENDIEEGIRRLYRALKRD